MTDFTPEQQAAVDHANRMMEQRRQLDEAAAELLAESNPPFVTLGFWARVWRWITR